ncbi:hypothetical protein [Gracilibacillus sp. YIM 98692]|uniref:hypothetical protein n=1 Tax=Gracilibacillus sp. YIM 98692 TaxID=2663532 RepID=UPI0013D4B956|nr:hypothetical protein [Gracilibacillus sp. YIM 98692]
MKDNKSWRILLFVGLIVTILVFVFITLYSNEVHQTFYTLEKAKEEIPDHHFKKAPQLPNNYNIRKITYDWDLETHPIIQIYYETKSGKEIKFMIASHLFDKGDHEEIQNSKISNISWVKYEEKYILKWKKEGETSFKYLISKNPDRNFLIKIAERY